MLNFEKIAKYLIAFQPGDEYKVIKPIDLGFGSNTYSPNPKNYIKVKSGEIIKYDGESSNGNVWFYYEGKRGKIEAGSISNLIDRGSLVLHKKH